jgi:hypothetical protein
VNDLFALFRRYLQVSEADALWATLVAALSYLALLVMSSPLPPAPIVPTAWVVTLAGTKILKNTEWVQNRQLARLDRLVKKGHMSPREAKLCKGKIIAYWLRSSTAVLSGELSKDGSAEENGLLKERGDIDEPAPIPDRPGRERSTTPG